MVLGGDGRPAAGPEGGGSSGHPAASPSQRLPMPRASWCPQGCSTSLTHRTPCWPRVPHVNAAQPLTRREPVELGEPRGARGAPWREPRGAAGAPWREPPPPPPRRAFQRRRLPRPERRGAAAPAPRITRAPEPCPTPATGGSWSGAAGGWRWPGRRRSGPPAAALSHGHWGCEKRL